MGAGVCRRHRAFVFVYPSGVPLAPLDARGLAGAAGDLPWSLFVSVGGRKGRGGISGLWVVFFCWLYEADVSGGSDRMLSGDAGGSAVARSAFRFAAGGLGRVGILARYGMDP